VEPCSTLLIEAPLGATTESFGAAKPATSLNRKAVPNAIYVCPAKLILRRSLVKARSEMVRWKGPKSNQNKQKTRVLRASAALFKRFSTVNQKESKRLQLALTFR